MPKPELDEHSLRSSLDPLLYGVAHGLAALFPPIETVRRPEADAEHGRPHEAGDETAGE